MDKLGKKLTDRELIEVVLAWYELDQSTEQLRKAVARYVQQHEAVIPSVENALIFEEPGAESLERNETDRNDSKSHSPESKSGTRVSVAKEVATYQPQFESTNELIGSRGWVIDAWALYYGTEEFFNRISFGLLNMQGLAVLFCILISATVMIGAWQSSLSIERQKKATFKSMEVESTETNRKQFPLRELNAPKESDALAGTEAADTSLKSIATPTSTKSSTFEQEGAEFETALSLIEEKAWDDALAHLQSLESDDRSNRQPLLSLVKVEALIQKRDAASMELARQLLMDCNWGEYEIIYDLLVARWMLLGNLTDRKRFLNEAASLPESARGRMSTWAHIRNGSKDALTLATLETSTSKGQSDVCDLLFIASFHFNVGRFEETIRELEDTRQRLLTLQATGNSNVENWLLETAKSQLASKVDEILRLVRSPRKQIN